MTYSPLMWSEDAEAIRRAVGRVADVPEPQQSAFRTLAGRLAHEMEGDFPDLDREIVGWISLRLAARLCTVLDVKPGVRPETLLLLGMLAGDHLVDGAS